MKRSLFFVLFLLPFTVFAADVTDIGGKITDARSGEPLAGAVVTIHELRRTAVSDTEGKFLFRNLPAKGRFVVDVHYIGYKNISRTIDAASVNTLDFALQTSSIEAQEVVVTGSMVSSDNNRNSTSVSVLDHDELQARPSTNIIDAISRVPGVSQITTGPAISKPVIRGLSANRVVTLTDGIKQQGQQWGDEHGIEIDQYSADRVEVLRGAASLLYGSDALGGAINILEPLPVPDGSIRGEALSNYSTNNGLTANSLMLNGNQNGFVWLGRGTYKNAYSFNTPGGYFPNSGFNEADFNGMVGLNKTWGYSHLKFSYFKNNIGFFDGDVNDNGQWITEDGEVYPSGRYKDRSMQYPRQDIRHYKVALNNSFFIGDGNLKVDIGYQQNQRRELEDGPEPSLFFDLGTLSGDAKYYFKENNGWQPIIGISADRGRSRNRADDEFLVPAYTTYGIGAFAYAKKNWEKSTFNAGIRYDYRNNDGEALERAGEQIFTGFKNSFSNVSGALGFTHELNSLFNFKANLSTGFRAPNPAELGSNGVHEGTFRYEIGNSDLKAERSYQADMSLDLRSEKVEASAGVFYNYISNYIYYANRNNETIEAEDQVFPVYRYVQDNAQLYGVEASLLLHPLSVLHLENTFSYTRAENLSLNRALPFIPAAALRNELRFEPKIRGMSQSYVSVGLDNFFRQNRIDEFETRTGGYSLLRAGIGTTLRIATQPVKLYVMGTNLLDKRYYDHLSRFKPGRFSEEDLSLGVYNIGRNITFGVNLPLTLKK
ncbi:MAG: TonB-dependent receptor [Mucilaginibacter polytrichastri]|nr:TonB-dependent receptor [Mucilaginibacter polytrichastri]